MKRLMRIVCAALTVVTLSGTVRVAQAEEAQEATTAAPDLSFDDLLPPTPSDNSLTGNVLTPPVDEKAIKTRRTMLTVHQTLGIALAAGMAGAMVTGQLNYNDKFLSTEGRNSGRFEFAHKAFVYPTLGLAATTAGLALFAPVPIDKTSKGFDRMVLHKIGQFTAAAGWAAQLGLGLYTASREGYANQQSLAAAHLAVGYVTLAGILLGLGAVVF